MFFHQMHNVDPSDLEGQFTPEEADRITTMRRQYQDYPDRYTFDINYQRLEFTRWLVVHGCLDEWREDPVAKSPAARGPRLQKHTGNRARQFT